MKTLKLLCLVASSSFIYSAFLISARSEQLPQNINLKWKCVSVQKEERYPCRSFSQTLRSYPNGQLELQDNGYLCANETEKSRVTYEAYLNRSASGKFVCKESVFDVAISYNSNVKFADGRLTYKLRGTAREQIREGRASSGQLISFVTKVDLDLSGAHCYATRSYKLSESFHGIPRQNVNYNYVTTSCSSSR